MAQNVRILRNWFADGELVFRAGQEYPADEASLRQVELGNGELVEAPDAAAPAEAAPADAAPADESAAPAEAAAPARRKKQA